MKTKNNKNRRIVFTTMRKFMVVALFVMILVSCSKDDGPSKDPDPDPTPVALTITAIDPNTGVAGTEVTITGKGFSGTAGENAVTFNGLASTLKSASATQILAVVPNNATTGAVAVTVKGKTASGPSFTVISGN